MLLEIYIDHHWEKASGKEAKYYELPDEATLGFKPWEEASVHPGTSGEIGVVTIEPPIVRVENDPLLIGRAVRKVELNTFPPYGNDDVIYDNHFGLPDFFR